LMVFFSRAGWGFVLFLLCDVGEVLTTFGVEGKRAVFDQ